jgi:hypothetical protein
VISPEENNEFIFKQSRSRRRKRKRSNSDLELDEALSETLRQKMDLLSTLRGRVGMVEQGIHFISPFLNATPVTDTLSAKQESLQLIYQTYLIHNKALAALEGFQSLREQTRVRDLCLSNHLRTSTAFIQWIRDELRSVRFTKVPKKIENILSCVSQDLDLNAAVNSIACTNHEGQGQGQGQCQPNPNVNIPSFDDWEKWTAQWRLRKHKTNKSINHCILKTDREVQYLKNSLEQWALNNINPLRQAIADISMLRKTLRRTVKSVLMRKKHCLKRQSDLIQCWQKIDSRSPPLPFNKHYPEIRYLSRNYYNRFTNQARYPIRFRRFEEFTVVSGPDVLDQDKMVTLIECDNLVQLHQQASLLWSFQHVPTVRKLYYAFAHGQRGYICTQTLDLVPICGRPAIHRLHFSRQLWKSLCQLRRAVSFDELFCYGVHYRSLSINLSPQARPLETDQAVIQCFGTLLHQIYTDGHSALENEKKCHDEITEINVVHMVESCRTCTEMKTIEEMPFWNEPEQFHQWNDNLMPDPTKLFTFVTERLRQLRRTNWETDPLLVDRKHIMHSVFNSIATIELDDENVSFKYELRYNAERGEGNGVTRDVYAYFFEMCSRHKCFEEQNGTYMPFPSGDLTCEECGGPCVFVTQQHFHLLGQIFAKLVYDEIPIPIRMNRAFTRYLMGRKATIQDIKRFDVDTYKMFHEYKRVPDIESYGLVWGELKPHAPQTLVTKESLDDFIDAKIQHILFDCRCNAMSSIRQGFLSFRFLSTTCSLLNINQLHSLLFGTNIIEYDEFIKSVAFTTNLPAGCMTRVAFLDWCQTENRLREFVTWASGYYSIPFSGLQIMIDLISRSDDGAYPQARSCFKKVSLPKMTKSREENLALFTQKMDFVFSNNTFSMR